MGMTRILTALGLAAITIAGGALAAPDLVPVRSGDDAGIEVKLCDDETTLRIAADTPKTRAEGQKIADALMSQWQQKHPEQDWVARERERHAVTPPADNSGLIGKAQGQVYGQVTPLDVKTWERETLAMAVHGSTVFHSGDELGSTIAVSCDMCHPDAANTHPETYPKFQPQLGRVALLRDMINWCIEHPVRGKALSADDPRMRALEAYILAQRKGKTLEHGKH